MDNYPTVAVLIPSFNRGELLEENLKYLSKNLKYAGEIKVVIGDDSDNDELAFSVGNTKCKFPLSYQHHTPRLGLGGNLNWLHAVTECEIGIALDDDHRLSKTLDITPFVEKLQSDPTAGWVRLMGTASHKLTAELEESFWRVSWQSRELYITSFRAHIFKLKAWVSMYGFYPITKFIGECEEQFNHNCIDIARLRLKEELPTLDVLVPLSAPEDCWAETGHSWQLQGY